VTNPPIEELRQQLDAFTRYRHEHLTGDEKGEAQLFLENLFKAFGHEGLRQAGATLEMRVARRDNRGTAYADLVWKPRVLIEMKKAGRDLLQDYRQAFEYWIDLVPDRPHYVVLCNFDDFWVYDLNRQLEEPVDRVALDDLPRRWEALAFLLPHEEEPTFGNDLVAVTRETAAMVSSIFNRLVERGIDRDAAQRFILQAVMAMFSEDIGLLPRHSFTKAVEDVLAGAGSAYDLLFGLFREMNAEGVTPGGRFEGTPYFNGGLYLSVAPFELTTEEMTALGLAAQENWAAVRPVIFGTLFEQSLGKPERHAYGAYFTSEADIQKVVLPSVVRPWRQRIEEADTLEELGRVEQDLLGYRVLDPACGSGNFLYVAYRELRRLERRLDEKRQTLSRRAGRRAEMRLGFVSTKQFFGIDLRPFAVEVAKVTLMLARKLAADELGDERTYLPLDDLDSNFQTANAILSEWPEFDICIGNPPFLGARNIQEEKSPEEVAAIRRAYPDIGGLSDYVSYWFRKTHDNMPDGGRAGLVGTANIRFGDTRASTLDYIVDNGGTITEAVAHQPWSGDATVEVSIVNWVKGAYEGPKTLWLSRGTVKMEVPEITGSLSPHTDLRAAKKLHVNRDPKVCFQGQTPQQTEGFVITAEHARRLVTQDPGGGRFIHPFLTGNDLNRTGQPSRFVIDIEADDLVAAEQAAPALLDYLREAVLPDRQHAAEREAERNRQLLDADPNARVNWHDRNFLGRWWQLGYRRADMVAALTELDRYVALSRVAIEHRQSPYVFVSSSIRPADALQVFAFDDEYSFGILHSTYHRAYFEERCSKMRVDLRYTPKTVFDTFPWPQAPTEESASALAEAAAALVTYQQEKLAEGMSLDLLYGSLRDPGRNQMRSLQETLDAAVAAVYGFAEDEDILAQLLALNLSIAEEEEAGITQPRRPGNEGVTGTRRTSVSIEPAERVT
jgi:SAM-dependent methyltransferase